MTKIKNDYILPVARRLVNSLEPGQELLGNFNTQHDRGMLTTVIDKQVKQLSDMQLELSQQEISIEDYNEISELIGNLKEYMINCSSYNS